MTTASTEAVSSPVNETAAVPLRRRWSRRLALLAVVVLTLYLGRAPLLTGAAQVLVVNEQAEQPSAIAILEGQRYYPTAAKLYLEQPHCAVLVLQPGDQWAEQAGAVPTTAETARRALTANDVQSAALEILDCANRLDATRLGEWLRAHPNAQLVLLCDRFSSRKVQRTVQDVLGDAAARVAVQGVAHPWYDETNWWQRKEGAVDLLNGYVGLVYVWLNGPDRSTQPPWNPADYRQPLAR